MRRRRRGRQGQQAQDLTGNLSRLIEPVLLYLLATDRAHYGYQFLEHADQFAITGANIDAGAVYRRLRNLEEQGLVVSNWEPGESGPAKRVYELTPAGLQQLQNWAQVLRERGASMIDFADRCANL
ncbi:MAG: helix-turn-helix transcriptional regulator [Armatimonadota bacterium]